jgi:hypothetical protein
MKTYKPEIYSQYRTGIMKEISGIVVGAAGVGFIAMGGLCMIMPEGGSSYVSMGPFRVESDNGNLKKVGPVLMAIGAVGLGVGIPLMISGGNKRKQILENFKSQHYSSPNSSAYFQMNLYSNGVGIAYVF